MGSVPVVADRTLTNGNTGTVGRVYRQLFKASLVLINATRIKVLFSRYTADWTITSAWVGHEGATGFTFDGNQVQLKFSGANGATFTADRFSDEIDLAVDETKNIVVSFMLTAGSVAYGTAEEPDMARSYVSSGSDAIAAASTWAGDPVGATHSTIGIKAIYAIVPDTAAAEIITSEPTFEINAAETILSSAECIITQPTVDIQADIILNSNLNIVVDEPVFDISTGWNIDCKVAEPIFDIESQSTSLASFGIVTDEPRFDILSESINNSLFEIIAVQPVFDIQSHDRFYNLDIKFSEPIFDIRVNLTAKEPFILRFPNRLFTPVVDEVAGEISDTILSFSR